MSHQVNGVSQPQMFMYNGSNMSQVPNMNGMPYQMNAMVNGQPAAVWNQQNGHVISNAPGEFHPIYHQHNQAQMQQVN